MTSPNRAALLRVARALGSLRDELVFVGGHVAELLVTDPPAVRVRPTDDVDVICRVTTQSGYDRLAERLRAIGFTEDRTPGAPLCRWRIGHDVLDTMPLSEQVLGFGNRWYEEAIRTASPLRLAADLEIRIPSAPAFLGTKWEAFDSRGAGDWHGSHDLEDVVTVVAGRGEIVEEIRAATAGLRRYLSDHARRFVEGGATPDVIAGALPDARLLPGLVTSTERRFEEIARM